MVSFRRSTTPSSGRHAPSHSSNSSPKPIFKLRFWSTSNKFTPLSDDIALSPTTPKPKPYVPRHAAADFSRNGVSDRACLRQRHSVAVMSVCQEDDATLCSYNLNKERKRSSVVVVHAKRSGSLAQNHRTSFVAQSNRESISLPNNRNSAMFHNNRNSIVYSPRRASRQLSLQSLAEAAADDDYAQFLAQAEFRNQMQSRASKRASIQVVPVPVPQARQDGRKGSVFAQRIVEYVRPPRQIC